jgi:uncharacterized protein DUF4129
VRALLALLVAAMLSSAQARPVPPPAPTAAPAPAPAHDLLAVIDDCAARLDSALDVGYGRIAARCPELALALTRSPWAAWLPADWERPDNQLSSAGLGMLRTLIARESVRDAQRRPPPRTMRLGAVLAAVTRSDDATATWWQRFKDLVRRIFTPQPRAGNDWLRRLVAELNLSGQTTELIAWGGFALVVALALAIVIGELRVAGLLGRGASRARTRVSPPRPRGAGSLEAIERAAPEEQPALLLELIASRLIEQRRLPPARALTARELGRRADLPQESGRGQLAELVAVCERVRFSDETVGSAILIAAMSSGRRLLATLDPAPTPAPEVR